MRIGYSCHVKIITQTFGVINNYKDYHLGRFVEIILNII